MDHNTSASGLWGLAILNSAIFIIFAFSFFKPKTRRDWRTFSAFSAFIMALFAEMYGYPLTIYLLAGWLQTRFPGTDFLTHDAGHIWYAIFGFTGDPHLNPIHIASNLLIAAGFILLSAAWRVLLKARQTGRLATAGPYAHIRHPQYAAFIVIMVGFLLQWPTILTVGMFPVLVTMYVHLAHREEREVATVFGDTWDAYAAVTPRWFPRLRRLTAMGGTHAEGRR